MPLTSSEKSTPKYIKIKEKEYNRLLQIARDKQINLDTCPTCGVRQEEVAPGIWLWPPSQYKLFNEVYPCDCEGQIRLMKLYLLAGIPKEYWTLSEDLYFGDVKALEAAQDYLEHWDDWQRHGIGISFYSPVLGTGKTMLAALIAKDLIKRGVRAYFVRFTEILRTYQMPYEAQEAEERRLRHTPLLVLDEVKEAISDDQWAHFSNQLEDLIRYRTSGNGVTITTTNIDTERLESQHPRTFSLLAAKQQFVHVNGEDVRIAGDVDRLNQELIRAGEVRPIV